MTDMQPMKPKNFWERPEVLPVDYLWQRYFAWRRLFALSSLADADYISF
jgi:hypothetical protein